MAPTEKPLEGLHGGCQIALDPTAKTVLLAVWPAGATDRTVRCPLEPDVARRLAAVLERYAALAEHARGLADGGKS